MKKLMLIFACTIITGLVQAAEITVGSIKYEITQQEKTGVGRFDLVYRVKITNPKQPTDQQVRSVVDDIFKNTITSLYWKGSLTTFIYIDDMPTDAAAYAIAEGHNAQVETFRVNKQQYEFWQMVRKK